MYTRLMTRPCVLRGVMQGQPDLQGNPSNTVVDILTRCDIQESSTYENRTEGTVSVSRWNLYLPPETDLDAIDTVIVDGQIYSVEGDPWKVYHPRTGAMTHIQASVWKVR